MTTRTWNGSTADFGVATDWSPNGVPVPGDLAFINSGTVTATGTDIAPYVFVLLNGSASSSPTLLLTNATVQAGTRLDETAAGSSSTLEVSGTVNSAGAVNLLENGTGNPILALTDAAGGGASSFVNSGAINMALSIGVIENVGTNTGSQIVNNGIISLQANSGSELGYVSVPITGTGEIRVGAGYELLDAAAIGSGQTVLFEARSSGNSTLEIDDANGFSGTIVGFGASDDLRLVTPAFNDTPQVSNANGNTTLIFSNNGTAFAQINLQGTYTTSTLSYTQTTTTSGATQTDISTTVPDLAPNFAFTDTSNDVVGLDSGTSPTAGTYQYNTGSSDALAVTANVSNATITSGNASDAIQVTGGTNVISAGLGSNFLVGAGAGSQDSFYMDGRSGNNWDTIVNFHAGDVATFVGFNAGTSTINWTATDGAAGYQGVTMHSELGGAATGFNGSITFAGVSLATQQSNFAISTGAGYIQIAYT